MIGDATRRPPSGNLAVCRPQRRKGSLVALLVLAILCRPATAAIGVIDDVPAATLLLPYFQVDLDDPNGVTTLFSVANAEPVPVIGHVQLWTDWSVPTISFNVYLTGYDVLTINLRDLFNGIVPQTDHNDLSPGPTISPSSNSNYGSFSLPSAPPPSTAGQGAANLCDAQLPTGPLPAVLVEMLRQAHTGQPVQLHQGACAGTDRGNNVAVGYITIDSVNDCTLEGPQSGDLYFGTASGPNNFNVLLGDYLYIDASNAWSLSETMVHIEADPTLGLGDYTFYRRYTGTASDQREPLGTSFWAPYTNLATELNVWRDGKSAEQALLTCGTSPSWYPLAQSQIVIFDEQETASMILLAPFGAETGKVLVGGPTLPVPFTSGWIYLNLNSTVPGQLVPFGASMQNWVTVATDNAGLFTTGHDAFQLDSALQALDVTIPVCDGEPDPAWCQAPPPGPRKMFLSSQSVTGNLGGLAGADQICSNLAAQQSLPGTWVALLSDETDDAYCRLQGLHGKRSDNCGLPGSLPGAGPWVRTDGKPFAAELDQMLAGTIYYPGWITETQSLVHSALTFTGSRRDGTGYGLDCANWTRADSLAKATDGIPSTSGETWIFGGVTSCDAENHLYCFETGRGAPLGAFAENGRPAFVTFAAGNGRLQDWPQAQGTGVAAGDAICRSLATNAGLANANSFKAWLSDTTVDAPDRFAFDGPWVRLDGVKIADNLADLLDTSLEATLSLTEFGTHIGVYPTNQAWAGTSTFNCSNWDEGSPSVSGAVGYSDDADHWLGPFLKPCNVGHRLYCFADFDLVIFADDFESGTTNAWSRTAP